MKKFTLGQNLLIVYGVFVVLFFLLNTSSEPFYDKIMYALLRADTPTVYLYNLLPDAVRPLILSVVSSLFGLIIFHTVIQGLVLYFGGNWLEKVLKKI